MIHLAIIAVEGNGYEETVQKEILIASYTVAVVVLFAYAFPHFSFLLF